MDQFIAKHADTLQGTRSCFDRVLSRGDRPFFSGYAMASFLEPDGIYRRRVKRFVLTQAYRLTDPARQLAAREERPSHYVGERTRKEDRARQVAERDGITEGLVGVFATVDPCRTFSRRWREGSAFIQVGQAEVPHPLLRLHGPRIWTFLSVLARFAACC